MHAGSEDLMVSHWGECGTSFLLDYLTRCLKESHVQCPYLTVCVTNGSLEYTTQNFYFLLSYISVCVCVYYILLKFLDCSLTGVPMEIMLKFNRLKTLSDDNKIICEAIKKSKSGLMEVRSLKNF